ncbi:MAG: FkbM family methyltransferase [Gaiellaceae bacterium]
MTLLERVVYPGFRRVDFRGKGRLRSRLAVPSEGRRVVDFPGGMRLRLDLRESLQRDFLFGLYDRHELRLLRRFLEPGGDFVDVGAHIGMYSVAAALALGDRGRVLAFEPNPDARGQLEENLALNGCGNVIVSPAAVSDHAGEALLHVPRTSDPSFSSLGGGRFAEGEPLRVVTTTLDDEVESAGLSPAFVKVDVEGGELAVLAGAERTLGGHPGLLVEVGNESARAAEERLAALGYRAFVVGRRRLQPGLASAQGTVNALFVAV